MAASASERSGTIAETLLHGQRLLARDPRSAVLQAREILRIDPTSADALRLLGAALRRSGDEAGAERAELDAISASVRDPDLIAAAAALLDHELAVAAHILRPRPHATHTALPALRLTARLAGAPGAS